MDVPPPGHRDRHRYAIDDWAVGIVPLDQVARTPATPSAKDPVDQGCRRSSTKTPALALTSRSRRLREPTGEHHNRNGFSPGEDEKYLGPLISVF
ncbi:hypothetical protein SBD_0141 [Streptomyces bottropensis ATCC 25435]|uniref:Uncharacterized protein n=1 Tax=Streptomyces bottropensis ATCC 25435 TaxID=1054862 RepID=M3FYW5_9ACTN|nr:hypothetical protein SBD_0141 [Streptomyces bottropensis ATCC 25435]